MKYRIVEYGAGYVVQKSVLGLIWFDVSEKYTVKKTFIASTVNGTPVYGYDFKPSPIKYRMTEEEAEKFVARMRNKPKRYREIKVMTDGEYWWTREWGLAVVAESEDKLHERIDQERDYTDKLLQEEMERKKFKRVVKVC